MNTPIIPTELNWVPERAKCSASEVFEKLRVEVEADVSERNKLRQEHDHYKFQFIDAGNSTFTVSLDGGLDVTKRVRFSLKQNHIVIIKEDGSDMFALAALNDEGRCVLRVNNQNYERWQVRKLALDCLFFEAPEKLIDEN